MGAALAVGGYGSTTILPLRWPVLLASSAAAVCTSGNVRQIGTRSRCCWIRETISRRARARIISRSVDVDLDARGGGVESDEGENAVGSSRQFYRDRDLSPPGRVEHSVDSLRGNRQHAFEKPVAVGDGLGADRTEVLVIALASCTYHAHTAGGSKLDGEGAHTASGGMDQQRLARAHIELLKRGPRGAPCAS